MTTKNLTVLKVAAALLAALALGACGKAEPATPAEEAPTKEAPAEATSTKDETKKDATAAPTTTVSDSDDDIDDLDDDSDDEPDIEVEAEATTQTPAATSDEYVGEDAAKKAALEHAGITEAECSVLQVSLDVEEQPVCYDVEFASAGIEYDYEIDALTGAVLNYDAEVDD